MSLVVENLVAGYGRKEVLRGATLEVAPGEIVLLIGPNGSGKSTLLRVIAGLLKPTAGRVVFQGHDITDFEAHSRTERGIAYLAQVDNVFPSLSVAENLRVAGHRLNHNGQWQERTENVFALFPEVASLKTRRAGFLSGGERQMLGLAITLMHEPKLLLLDEPSAGGLSPALVIRVFQTIQRMNEEKHTSILLAEQNIREAAKVADRIYLLKGGRTESEEHPEEVLNTDKLEEVFFGAALKPSLMVSDGIGKTKKAN